MNKQKQVIANFQIPASLKKRAEARARKEGVSFSAMLRRLIKEYLTDVKLGFK